LSFILPASGYTLLVVAAGLSQIGEFSFIVGQAGVSLGILAQDQYGLILAGAVLSMIVNPLAFRAIPLVERGVRHIPFLWERMEYGGPTPELLHKGMRDHVVIVGYGRVGMHIGRVLEHLNLPYLVVEQDAIAAVERQRSGVQTLFGDAANSELLTHTGLENARALVVTVSNETTAELVVAAAHDLAPNLPIIARAGTESGVQRLTKYGAHHVIHPELEGGLEIVRHTLLTIGFQMEQIQQYVDAVRRDAYAATLSDNITHRVLDQLLTAVRRMEIAWQPVPSGSQVIGQSLAEANIRANTGASVIALVRDQQVLPNPKSDTRFLEGDMLGLIGNVEELALAAQLISSPAIQEARSTNLDHKVI
jgi:monovalent cation:H+ antiporter-2, CPA2 family